MSPLLWEGKRERLLNSLHISAAQVVGGIEDLRTGVPKKLKLFDTHHTIPSTSVPGSGSTIAASVKMTQRAKKISKTGIENVLRGRNVEVSQAVH